MDLAQTIHDKRLQKTALIVNKSYICSKNKNARV